MTLSSDTDFWLLTLTFDTVREAVSELISFETLNVFTDVFEIYTATSDLYSVADTLKANGVSVLSAEVDMIPDNEVDPEGHLASVEKMINLLEELDDVQNVYHNAILPEPVDED